MTARYLVRLDDACPTMNRERWTAVEAMLDELAVKPIVAVVPDNRDPDLVQSPPDPQFWQRVKGWEAKGWSIAMHGLHHLFHDVDRKRLIIPFHDRSEFAGLDYTAQAALIAKSWAVFEAKGVRPSVWVAPGHSFDELTVTALRNETPIRIISDGLSINHYREEGFTWLPQQMWNPAPQRWGLWTICVHPNMMDEREIGRLRSKLSEPYYCSRLATVPDLALADRRKNVFDRLYARYFFARGRAISTLLPLYHAGKRIKARLASL
jgi:predicted deacetylase